MNNLGTITIETERLILRKFVDEDLFNFYKNWASDEEVTKTLTWPKHDNISMSKTILNHWILNYPNPMFFQWAITLKNRPNEVIGSISLDDVNIAKKEAEIGYCLARKYWGQGLTSEAAKAVIKFAFNNVGFLCIYGAHIFGNIASGKVLEKVGFKHTKEKVIEMPLKHKFYICKCYEIHNK